MYITANYLAEIEQIKKRILSADAVIIGAGAGLSAAGGINYSDPELFKRWFRDYEKFGLKTILEVQGALWNPAKENVLAYYAYWARHIDFIRYKTLVLKPYLDLRAVIADKPYFVITTNVDGQFAKAGFSDSRIYAMQGDYALFQCSVPCRQQVFENKVMIDNIVSHIEDSFYIRPQDIPRCPHCGNLLVPNLRKDRTFVEAPHLKNKPSYEHFMAEHSRKNVVLLELGVGFNTPGIIRYPFERLAYENPENFFLLRLNLGQAEVPARIRKNSVGLSSDLAQTLSKLSA